MITVKKKNHVVCDSVMASSSVGLELKHSWRFNYLFFCCVLSFFSGWSSGLQRTMITAIVSILLKFSKVFFLFNFLKIRLKAVSKKYFTF